MLKQQEIPTAWGNKIYSIDGSLQPYRAHPYDAGRDLYIQDDITILPNETLYLGAGVKLDLKPGWSAHVITRSSTFKKQLTVTPSIIDCGYKNEISTIVSNHTDKPISIKRGDRLAQLILVPIFDFENEYEQVKIGKYERKDDDRFGSSGDNHLCETV